jgi:ABC-type dipeptide/oligopeptide/nickel transport system permease component
MGRYIARRLFYFVPTLLVVSIVTFALGIYGPGDPIRNMMGSRVGDEVAYQNLRREYGLDRPFLVQWTDYIWNAVRGDFGESFVYRDQPVGPRLFNGLKISAQLALVAGGMALVLGIPLGMVAALRRNTGVDYVIGTAVVLISSIPSYVLGPALMIVLVLHLQILGEVPLGWEGILSEKVLLPAFVLALSPMVALMRQTRAAVGEVLGADYVRTARAKGLGERLVLWRHIWRSAMGPIVTVAGLMWGEMITVSVFVETIFAIPGFGRLFATSIPARDYAMLMSTVIVASFILIAVNLVVDICYAKIDPRVRYE